MKPKNLNDGNKYQSESLSYSTHLVRPSERI